MAQEPANKPKASVKQIFNLIKDYFWNSDQRLIAWALLIGIVLCIIASVALMTLFAWWSAGFWAVLTAKALAPFLISIAEMCGLICASLGVYVLKSYLIGKLTILWRNWLTTKTMRELFVSVNNFVDLERFPELIKNVSQRIQEDVKSFVELTISLSTTVFSSVLSLFAFTGTLWVVGGALSFVLFGLNIVIPGFLVWAALIVAIAATVATHFIGKKLQENTQATANAEADLRRDLTQLSTEAENIAEEHAEDYYIRALNNTVQRVKDTSDEKLKTETKLNAFQHFSMNIIQFLPTIFAAPAYFAGLIEIGQLMQIGMSFMQVSMALTTFADSYGQIAQYKTNIDRIIELQNSLANELPNANPKRIIRKERDKETIRIKDLAIQEPEVSESSSGFLMRGLSLKLLPGEHVLIRGENGIGKSTLFKVISGTWGHGSGKVSVPSPEQAQLYFSPQFPTMHYGTLKADLSYPEPEQNYTNEECVAVLRSVGMTPFTAKLGETRDWSTLSGGQKQKIAFGRVLLKKPKWAFFDEATSSMDKESEKQVYRAMQEESPDTTMVGIGHHETVDKYYSRILFFKIKNEEHRIIEVVEKSKNLDEEDSQEKLDDKAGYAHM